MPERKRRTIHRILRAGAPGPDPTIVAEILDGNLPEVSLIAAQADVLFQDAGRAEGTANVGEPDLSPLPDFNILAPEVETS